LKEQHRKEEGATQETLKYWNIPSEVQPCESTFSKLDTEKEAKIWIVSKKWSRMNTSGIHLILLSAMSTAFLIWLAFSMQAFLSAS